jgi:hypothetical protein
MSNCSDFKNMESCPSRPICQWLNNKCKNHNLVDLNNSFAFNVTESLTNISDNDNSDLAMGVQNTLENIKMIQSLESEIYDKLLKNDITQELSSEEKQKLLNELTNLSTIKINLYDSIKDTYHSSVTTMATSQQSIMEQLAAIKIVEAELKNSAARMNDLDSENINTMRMIEINRYYEEKYNDYSGFIKYLILFIVTLLIIYILNKKLFISDNIYKILLFIVILCGVIVLGKYYYKMMFRSNMVYQEYVYPYANQVGSTSTDTNVTNPWENPIQTQVCPTSSSTPSGK